MQAPVLILSADPHAWLIPAVCHQLNKHWQPRPPVIVAGFTPIPKLPMWAEWLKIGDFFDYPVTRWSDGLAVAAEQMPERFILLLDDYLILRRVDTVAIDIITDYMQGHNDILRFDLCTDRLYNKHAVEAGALGRLDLIETKPGADYQLSTQPSMFDRDKLLALIKPNESPWQFELNGSERANATGWRVVGTRQAPVRCKIAVNKGKFDLDTPWQVPPAVLSPEDRKDLEDKGMLR